MHAHELRWGSSTLGEDVAYVMLALLGAASNPHRALVTSCSVDIKRGFWYWEGVVAFRKILLAAVAVFGETDAFIALYVQSLIVTISLILHVRFRPYEGALLNRLEALSLATILATQVGRQSALAMTSCTHCCSAYVCGSDWSHVVLALARLELLCNRGADRHQCWHLTCVCLVRCSLEGLPQQMVHRMPPQVPLPLSHTHTHTHARPCTAAPPSFIGCALAAAALAATPPIGPLPSHSFNPGCAPQAASSPGTAPLAIELAC